MHEFFYHSVGQGLFFEGNFLLNDRNFIIVYDCGAESTFKSSLSNSINFLKNRINHIDMLIISHFDFDHISGVHELLKNCTVSHIVLPYLRNEEILMYLLSQKELDGEGESFFISFLKNPIEFFGEFEGIEQLTFITTEFEKSFWLKTLDIFNVDNLFEEVHYNYRGRIKVEVKRDSDYYRIDNRLKLKFFNYPISEQKRKAFLKKIEEEMMNNNDASVDNLAHRILSDFSLTKSFKAKYENINKSNHNNVSLLLMYDYRLDKQQSSLRIDYIRQQLNLFGEKESRKRISNSRIVHFLTGDISLQYVHKQKKIYKHYSELLPVVSVVQVPHHGSKHNWNNDLLHFIPNDSIFVVSSGVGNKYHHPHSEVTRDIVPKYKLFRANNQQIIHGMII